MKKGAPSASSRLWVAYLIGAFGLGMSLQLNFLIPLRARELGASFDVIGLIVGVGALASAVFAIPMGTVIDRIGAKRSFVVGTALSAVFTLLLILGTSYWHLFIVQPFLGTVKIFAWLASQSYITSVGKVEQRASLTGRFAFFSSAAQMVAPLAAGAVAELLGFRGAFLLPVVYALTFSGLGLFLVAPDAPTDAHETDREIGLRSSLGLSRLRGMQVALLLTFSRLWVTWIFATFFPVYLVDTGLGPGVVGTVVATSGLVATMLSPMAGLLVRVAAPEKMAAVSLGLGGLALLLAGHLSEVPAVYIVPVLVGVGSGLSLPLLLTIVTTAVPPESRGTALGLRAMVSQAAATAAPVTVGPLIASLGVALGFQFGGLATAGLILGSVVLHMTDQGSRDRPSPRGPKFMR